MTLLREIQTAATDTRMSVADVLRRCQILAFRLDNQDFKDWVAQELNGYPHDAVLPPYRRDYRGHVKAHLFGVAGAQIRNASVPVTSIPEAFAPWREFEFREGAAALQDMLRSAEREGTNLMRPFPVESHAAMAFVRGYTVMQMWAELSPTVVAGILDQIRNKALEFTLELERQYPEAGEDNAVNRQPPPEQVGQTFTNVILGGNVNVSQASHHLAQSFESRVVAGDFASLRSFLVELGVTESEVGELDSALATDETAGDSRPGPATGSWIARVAARLASSGGKIGEASTAGLIVAAIVRFLGLA